MNVRRALLRVPVQRIGLGGYLHLTEKFPEYQDYIEEISDKFREIQNYHSYGKPYTLKPKVAVLHYWGKLRAWTLSGHFHETYMHDLVHINEALSGLPLDVYFIDFEDVKQGALGLYDVVINAGSAGTAWSGGKLWEQEDIVSKITKWVSEGGLFIGVNEPTAVSGYHHYFRMATVLGVDENIMSKVCHGKWKFKVEKIKGLLPEGYTIPKRAPVSLTDGTACVLVEEDGDVKLG